MMTLLLTVVQLSLLKTALEQRAKLLPLPQQLLRVLVQERPFPLPPPPLLLPLQLLTDGKNQVRKILPKPATDAAFV
tara:strand:+ start:138 stop:368 length:231 start_codon:yes stop_codon:yes gene_type:complete